TTCVIDFAGAGLESPQDTLAAWHHKAQGRAAVDYAFHLTVTDVPHDPAQAEVGFRWFVSEGVTSVKLYLAHPDRLMVDDGTLARALAAGKATGVLVCVHAESGRDAARLTEDVLARDETSPEALPLARPAWIEAE